MKLLFYLNCLTLDEQLQGCMNGNSNLKVGERSHTETARSCSSAVSISWRSSPWCWRKPPLALFQLSSPILSYRQFLSFIDVASLYCNAPINPHFLLDRLYWSIFSSPPMFNCLLLNPHHFFFIPTFSFFFIWWEMSNSYHCHKHRRSMKAERGCPEEERREWWPFSLWLTWEIFSKCQQGLMVALIWLRQREWYLHINCSSVTSVKQRYDWLSLGRRLR